MTKIICCKLHNNKISIFGRENGGEERGDKTKETKEKRSPGGCDWREEWISGLQGKEVLEGKEWVRGGEREKR